MGTATGISPSDSNLKSILLRMHALTIGNFQGLLAVKTG